MPRETIQIRNVPAEDVQVLRARARARNVSLSHYLRGLIHDCATRPEVAEVLQRISTRAPVEVDSDEVRSFIEEGRQ